MSPASWMLVAVLMLAVPAWAWNGYRSYGGGSLVQLHNQLSQLERQVRDLQREVDRLRAGSAGAGTANRYPLPGQDVYGLRPARQGAYALSLNGSSLRFEPDGAVRLQAAGTLHLEGATVVTRARNAEGADSTVSQPSPNP